MYIGIYVCTSISLSFKRLQMDENLAAKTYFGSHTKIIINTHIQTLALRPHNTFKSYSYKRSIERRQANHSNCFSILEWNSFEWSVFYAPTHTTTKRKTLFQFWSCFCLHFLIIYLLARSVGRSFVRSLALSFARFVAFTMLCDCVKRLLLLEALLVLPLWFATAPLIPHIPFRICIRIQSMPDIEVERCGFLLLIRRRKKLLTRSLFVLPINRVVFCCCVLDFLSDNSFSVVCLRFHAPRFAHTLFSLYIRTPCFIYIFSVY